jgi:hypothetical protein
MATQTALQFNQIRDQIRRLMQVQPLYDNSLNTGDWGNPTTSQPEPNNILLNQVINESIDAINRIVRCGAITMLSGLAVSAVAAYAYGPAYIDYSSVLTNVNDVSEIINAVWVQTASGQIIRLEPYNYYAPSRKYEPYQQYAPAANPIQWQDAGNQIMLLPPPSTAGTLYLTQQEGIPYPASDSSAIAFLPVSYHATVWYLSTAILSARAASDVEALDRFQKFYMLGVSALQQIYAWKNGNDEGSMNMIADTLQMIPGIMQARGMSASSGSPVSANSQAGS